MPIHDWTRVLSNRFHCFHQTWTVGISHALNAGRLPPGYFAMIQSKAHGPEPEDITHEFTPPDAPRPGDREGDLQPPMPGFVLGSEAAGYARKANRITIHHPDGAVAAVVETLSPGNKESRQAINAFAQQAVGLLRAGVHLLIVDLFPPSVRDPQGIHNVIWGRLGEELLEIPPDKPLTLASYTAGPDMVGYIEPVAVGDSLIDMPIFLTRDRYVPCPLEATYQTAWEQFPAPLKGPLESPPAR
jgi:hypothetical protein